MATTSHSQFSVGSLDVGRGGASSKPAFQRDYVWRRSRAPHLIDSLYRGFPISSLLLWQSTEETRSRRRDPRPVRSASRCGQHQ
ncbi:MAG: DUF262 domain-containing protein [Burkholderiales bacterium]